MTDTFEAQWARIEGLLEDQMEAVFLGAVQDTSELMTRRAEGIGAGGSRREGFVPVVTSELINSQETRLNGSKIGEGSAAGDALASLTIDDIAEHVFTAEHARAQEYGFRIADDSDTEYSDGDVDVPGWFFVFGAVQQWDTIVEQNVRHIKE